MLDANHVKIGINVATWKEAIESAGEILIDVGSCSVEYVREMIAAVEELGPYIVITPHVAIAHARPGLQVNRSDMSLVVLDEGVEFGSVGNDPVKLVFAFCATDDEGHLQQLGKLAENLNPETVTKLSEAGSVEEIIETLGR